VASLAPLVPGGQEGIEGGQLVLAQEGTAAQDAPSGEVVRLIRLTERARLMYQKEVRLGPYTGVAENRGAWKPILQDIELAVHTEVPLVKQHPVRLHSMSGRYAVKGGHRR
jgi:hypothetical protein